VRAAGVLLPKETDPVDWAKDHLADDLSSPVHSI
jgi:hypothetical protein